MPRRHKQKIVHGRNGYVAIVDGVKYKIEHKYPKISKKGTFGGMVTCPNHGWEQWKCTFCVTLMETLYKKQKNKR